MSVRMLPAEVKRRERTRVTTRSAILNGTLVRPERCQKCKRRGVIHAHHPDYSDALRIEWLCRPCHQRHHHTPRRVAMETVSVRLPPALYRRLFYTARQKRVSLNAYIVQTLEETFATPAAA